MIIILTVGLTKKILLYEIIYLPETHTHSKDKVEVELDLPYDASKSELKNVTVIDTSDVTKKLI